MNTRENSSEEPTISELLFDYAVAHPNGFTNRDAMHALDITIGQFERAARVLRKAFRGDSINLIANPAGHSVPWTYQLTGTFGEAEPWVNRSLDQTTARIDTINAVVTSAVNATDGRSIAGRRSRLIEKTTRRLIEDLAELNN